MMNFIQYKALLVNHNAAITSISCETNSPATINYCMIQVARSFYRSGSHKQLITSYVKGSHAHKAVHKSVAQVFREVTEKYPNNFALHSYDQDVSLTY